MTPRSQSQDHTPDDAGAGGGTAGRTTSGTPEPAQYGPPGEAPDLDDVRRAMADLEDSNRMLFEQVKTLQAMLVSRAASSNGTPSPGDRPEVRAAIQRHEAIRLALLDPVNQWRLSNA